MNNSGRGNWFFMFFIFVIGFMVIVGALSVAGYDVVYSAGSEDDGGFVFNFSKNVTFAIGETLLNYSIDDSQSNKIYLNSILQSKNDISSWVFLNQTTGMLFINSTQDEFTGLLELPLAVTVSTSGGGTLTARNSYNFTINATNDAPNFTSGGIANNYSFAVGVSDNFILTARDEDNHFPLIFNATFNATNCTHGVGTGYADNSNCSLFDFGMTLVANSNTTAIISFQPTSSHVGTYWANVSVRDAAANYNCPTGYCDASYNTSNKTTYYSRMVRFVISPTMSVNASNCSGSVLMENQQFNCTIVITTPNEADSLTLTSLASFRNELINTPYNTSWFALGNYSPRASNFNHNVSVSVTPNKNNVGNYTINFTVNNGIISPVSVPIYIYVNYTESNVTMNNISDDNFIALYENATIDVVAIDRDLLIRDSSVKSESLTFSSNTSWVSYRNKTSVVSTNYSTAVFDVNWNYAVNNLGENNYSILINVTDGFGNTDNRTLIIQISNETAPAWSESLDSVVNLALTEGVLFTYNLSMNVSDVDDIVFYYRNVSAEFCSLNSTNFNFTTGIINFTPQDCDVGYHNVLITASDMKLNSSKSFNLTVGNVVDSPLISNFNLNGGSTIADGQNRSIVAGVSGVFNLYLDDDDFNIPTGQRGVFYNESLTIDVIATNSTSSVVDLFEFSFASSGGISDVFYNVSFTPLISQIDNYTIFVNVTDRSGAFTNVTFFLNITESTNPPVLSSISNKSLTIYDILNFNVSATDYEDDYSGINLTYNILNLSVGAPNLTIGSVNGSVVFNMNSNPSYAGAWIYNITVTDSSGQKDWQGIYIYIYGNATLLSPVQNGLFNLTENVSSVLNFSINHSVADILVYEFWLDSIGCSYQNSTNCTYGSLALRSNYSSFGNGTFYNWSFVPSYTDETYGNLKNLTVRVYPNSSELNSTQKAMVATNFTFKLNISHTNAPPEVYNSFGSNSGTYGASSPISLLLTSYIRDYDYLDSYYLQNVIFNVTSEEGVNSQIYAEGTGGSNQLPWSGLVDSWSLQLYALTAVEERIIISANDSFTTDVTDPFVVIFTAPSVVSVPTQSGGGGSSTKLKHFSMNLIAPQDVIISERGYIDIPFSIQNDGQTDLFGISISSLVRFNDVFSDDVKISLDDSYIKELKFGESKNFSMRIVANTQRAGKYKATIFANVTSPKFSDFADFFVDIKKANESEAEQILIFTNKFISDNPECLELTELLKRAQEAYEMGEYSNAIVLAEDVVEACENSIGFNEQIKHKIDGFVRDNLYSVSLITLVVFFAGFIFYIYKRVRFNKSKIDEYV